MSRTRIILAAVLLTAVSASIAAAHDLFIKLDTYHLPPSTAVQVPIINGTFRLSENSITPERVSDVSIVFEGGRRTLGLDTWNAERDTTFLGLRTGDAGTYLLGVSTLPNGWGWKQATSTSTWPATASWMS